jgi:hypothetical protein
MMSVFHTESLALVFFSTLDACASPGRQAKSARANTQEHPTAAAWSCWAVVLCFEER